MEAETTEVTTPPPVDAFDAAVTATSNYVEPKTEPIDVDAAAQAARDDKGRFASTKPAEPKADEAEKPLETKVAEKKPRNDPQARIDQAIARQREAERRADEAARRAEEAERRAAERLREPERIAPEPVKADKFPTYAQYLDSHGDASLEDYMDARDDWKDQRREATFREQREVEQAEQSFTSRASM